MSQYQDLIDKVRAATGPDRELDGDIFFEIDPKFPSGSMQMTAGPDPATFATGAYASAKAPEFTASIDAALALVERCLPGWNWHLNRLGQPRAIINDGPRAQFECWRNTALPLAMIESLLLALQSNEATNVEDK